MICSAVLSIVGILALCPLYYGWWEPGRNFPMSPPEIARAFDAPLMRGVDGNTTAERMVEVDEHESGVWRIAFACE